MLSVWLSCSTDPSQSQEGLALFLCPVLAQYGTCGRTQNIKEDTTPYMQAGRMDSSCLQVEAVLVGDQIHSQSQVTKSARAANLHIECMSYAV